MLRWPDWLHQLEVFYRCLKTLFDARLRQTQTLQDLTLLTFAHCLKQKNSNAVWICPLYKKNPPRSPCLRVTAVARSLAMLIPVLSCDG